VSTLKKNKYRRLSCCLFHKRPTENHKSGLANQHASNRTAISWHDVPALAVVAAVAGPRVVALPVPKQTMTTIAVTAAAAEVVVAAAAVPAAVATAAGFG